MKRLKKKKHEKLEQVIQTKLTLNENEENLDKLADKLALKGIKL